MVNCLPEFEYFTVFLKNRNFISKLKRSKITDYAALKYNSLMFHTFKKVSNEHLVTFYVVVTFISLIHL